MATINGTSGNDSLPGTAGNDTIDGREGDDDLNGAGGDDLVIGGLGGDLLIGGAGTDHLRGGAGDDTYLVNDGGDLVEELNHEGYDLVRTTISYVMPAFLEELELRGTAAIDGTGNAEANILRGNSGANLLTGLGGKDSLFSGGGNDQLLGGSGKDQLDGGLGADQMNGGLDSDVYRVDDIGDTVSEAGGSGIDLVLSSVRFTLAADVENLTVVGTADVKSSGNDLANLIIGNGGADRIIGFGGDDDLRGGAGSDVLVGGDGNDRLDGGTGTDRMEGGAGDDLYLVDNVGDVVIDDPAAVGVDSVHSSVRFVLPEGVENLLLTGSDPIRGKGNSGNNLIIGNSAANILQGYAGDDTLSGQGGDDTIIGGDGDNVLVGGGGNDLLSYADEVDGVGVVLSGETTSSADHNGYVDSIKSFERLITGAGDDYVTVDSPEVRAVDTGGGYDIVSGGADYLIGFDMRPASAPDSVLLQNVEYLDMEFTFGSVRFGPDVTGFIAIVYPMSVDFSAMSSGVTLDATSNGIQVDQQDVISGGQTIATINYSGPVTTTLSNYDDQATASGTMFGLAGNDQLDGSYTDDTIHGGSGNDTLNGLHGEDYLYGEDGDDILWDGGTASNYMYGGAGNDILNMSSEDPAHSVLDGGTGNDILNGGEGKDSIHGGDGDDQIHGRYNDDTLSGGAGADLFYFETALNSSENVDTISDFSVADDTFMLSRSIFSGIGSDGTLDPSAFATGTAASDADDRIVYDSATGNIFYDADGNGAGAALLFAHVTAGTALTNLDFTAYTPV